MIKRMMMKLDGGYIFVKADREEEASIKTWRMMSKDKKNGWWYARTSIQLLEKIYDTWGLIPAAKKEMERLRGIQAAVDRERIRPAEELKPMAEYPVKPKLYAHQVRAANMALMVFGMAKPPGEGCMA